MNAGNPIPEVKSAKKTITALRELLGWPAWTDEQFGKPKFEWQNPAGAAPEGGQ